MSEGRWLPPPPRLELGGDEVHVWRVSVDAAAARLAELHDLLQPDEQERAARFHFERDRRRCIVARGVLRRLLGGYLGIQPAHVRLAYADHGKPALALEHGDPLRFNVSHSGDLVLLAFTRGREVGIDVEHIREDLADKRIAERFFSAREVAVLRALPPEARRDAFFACWTRKESYVKARGEGLSLPLHAFDVSLAPGEPAALLRTEGDPAEASRWTLRALDPGPGYAAALAVEGSGWVLTCWEWEG